MQQKLLKYLLLAGVAIIWGTVLYRILNNIDNNPDTSQPLVKKLTFTDKDSSSYQPYSLLVNYDDPFGADDEIADPTTQTDIVIKETNTLLSKKSDAKMKPDIGFIKYKGIISNSITKKKAAIISINGKDELARVNKVVNNIKINAIKKDRIQVTYKRKKYWIKMQ